MDVLGTSIDIPEGWSVSRERDRCFLASYSTPDGSVELVCHAVLPGILLMSVELDCRQLPMSSPFKATPLSINWCSKGRCEVDLGERGGAVVGEGTLCLSSSTAVGFSYPTGSYRGFECYIDLQQLGDITIALLREIGISEKALLSRLFPAGRTLTLAPSGDVLDAVTRIDGELHHTEPRLPRLILATLELLVALSEQDLDAAPKSGAYLQRSQRDMAGLVHKQLLESCTPTAELDTLASQLGVSEASLRAYFGKVYGESPASFARRHCLEHARDLLEATDDSVGDVALSCGYANQSKFAAAFRRLFGTSPLEARRRARIPTDSPPASDR